ncbi:MAG TPA: sortase [Armatimonadota bacterium]
MSADLLRNRNTLNRLANAGLVVAVLLAFTPFLMRQYGHLVQARARAELEREMRQVAATRGATASAPRARPPGPPSPPTNVREPAAPEARVLPPLPSESLGAARRHGMPRDEPSVSHGRSPGSSVPLSRATTGGSAAPRIPAASVPPSAPNTKPRGGEAVAQAPMRKRKPGRWVVGEISIPALGLSTVVVEGNGNWRTLAGPGHEPRSPLPGEGGNCVIAAHRNMWDESFRDLPRVRPGDTVVLSTPSDRLAYRVTTSKKMSTSDLTPLRSTNEERLTLYTCVLPFDARYRWVVQARRVPS